MAPFSKSFSTASRSLSHKPPWWTPTPNGNEWRSAGSRARRAASSTSTAYSASSHDAPEKSSSAAADEMRSSAVKRVWRRDATKMSAGFLGACSRRAACAGAGVSNRGDVETGGAARRAYVARLVHRGHAGTIMLSSEARDVRLHGYGADRGSKVEEAPRAIAAQPARFAPRYTRGEHDTVPSRCVYVNRACSRPGEICRATGAGSRAGARATRRGRARSPTP